MVIISVFFWNKFLEITVGVWYSKTRAWLKLYTFYGDFKSNENNMWLANKYKNRFDSLSCQRVSSFSQVISKIQNQNVKAHDWYK